MTDVRNQRVLITGGSRGIGRLMAGLLAERGAEVVIWGRNPERLVRTVDEIRQRGGRAAAQVCDVGDRASVYATAAELKAHGGPVHVLINNAGIVAGRPLLELTDEQIERTLQVNALAHFWTTRALLPDMLAANAGHLVTISSGAGLIGLAALTDYCASKFAAFGFHEALRRELRKRGSKIETTVVCPYYIDTGMFEGVRTRVPLLLPILKPEVVALRVVRAIEKNRPQVVLPPLAYTIPIFRLLPVSVGDKTADLLGLNSSMDTFVGRSEPTAPPPARPEPSLRAPRRALETEQAHASAE